MNEYYQKIFDDMLAMSHPEKQEDELFITNEPINEWRDIVKWNTARSGMTAYCTTGEVVPRRH